MKQLLRTLVVLTAGAFAWLTVTPGAVAAEPPWRIVVPTPAGTSADLMARLLAEHMGATLAAPFLVENKPGASGAIAVESVLQPGSTAPALLLAGLDHIVYGPAALGRKAWDPLADLKLIGLVNNDRWMLIGNPASIGSMRGLLQKAKERPLRCANTGLGTTQHAVCAWTAHRLGIEVEHIPYSQPFMPDLIAGRVDIAALPVPGAAAVLQAGRVNGLMLLSRDRHPAFDTVFTSVELSFTDLVFESGLALYAAPTVPDREVDRLHDALQRAQGDERIRTRLRQLGVDPAPATRAAAAQQLRIRLRLNDEVRREAFGKSR